MAAGDDAGQVGALPLHFGSLDRRLYGVLYRPAGGSGSAVLICNPLGQEALRAHRLLRVLASRLARQGFSVLRFDYFGTGESMGDDEEGSLDGWAGDVATAHGELLARSGVSRTIWIGMGLGANVAAMAAEAGREPTRLVLLEPVRDGAAYLRWLAAERLRTLGLGPDYRGPEADDELPGGGREVLGFSLSATMVAAISAIAPQLPCWRNLAMPLVVLDAEGRLDEWVDASDDSRVRRVHVDANVNWAAEAADGASLVPSGLIAELLREATVA